MAPIPARFGRAGRSQRISDASQLAPNYGPASVLEEVEPCRATTRTSWPTTLRFERTSKRRRGFPQRSSRQARRPRGARLQGARREARPQRPLPLRIRTPLSRPVVCVPVASTVRRGATTAGT